MFWSIVGQASIQTARAMGPSTMERSSFLAVLGGADMRLEDNSAPPAEATAAPRHAGNARPAARAARSRRPSPPRESFRYAGGAWAPPSDIQSLPARSANRRRWLPRAGPRRPPRGGRDRRAWAGDSYAAARRRLP